MNAIHRQRLKTLRTFINKLPKEKFDIGEWCESKHKCGTVACVLGWAGLIPEFRAAGLTTDKNVKIIRFTPTDPFELQVLGDEYRSYEKAASAFFGLDILDAKNLIYPDCYPEGPVTRRDVSNKITSLLEKYL